MAPRPNPLPNCTPHLGSCSQLQHQSPQHWPQGLCSGPGRPRPSTEGRQPRASAACRRGRPESPADPGGLSAQKAGDLHSTSGPPATWGAAPLRASAGRAGALRPPQSQDPAPHSCPEAVPARAPSGSVSSPGLGTLKRLSYDSGTPGASGRSARRPVLLLRQPWAPLPARGPARRGMVCPLLPWADLSPLTLRSD